ncbi:FAD-dependent oxidoreductase [Candidatus Woesebacteria bacterium]|nr:FAD-dependent oxidoreductase [Candidatus Woesebacteria bacterium]
MLITYQSQLLEKTVIAPDVLLLKFEKPPQPDWDYKAGQYMILHVPTGEANHPARRLYSIASSPTEDSTLNFIIELVPNGIGSTYIKNLEVGAKATLQGPAGLFTYSHTGRDVIMLATGTGIAPMYGILRTVLAEERDIQFKLLWGMKQKKDLYLLNEFAELAKTYSNFSFTICLSREESVDHPSCMLGRVTTALDQMKKDGSAIQDAHFYLCGGKNVVEALREDLSARGIGTTQIHFERFT